MFFVTLLLLVSTTFSVDAHRKVLLTDVNSLTLQKGRMTTGRRGSPVPQTTCLSGAACNTRHEPEAIQCSNRGSDGVDVQWECKAELAGNLKFGQTTVVCEGYDYAEDPYILAGSCGIEYTLIGTPSTSQGQGHDGYSYDNNKRSVHTSSSSSFGIGDLISWAMVLVGLYYIFSWATSGPRVNYGGDDRRYGGNQGQGWGGGGYGGGGGGGGGGNYGSNAGGGGNNFWMGLLGGYTAANMFGGNRGYGGYGRNYGYGNNNYGYGGGGGWGGRGGWGQGGGGTRASTTTTTQPTRQATAFAGTRRR